MQPLICAPFVGLYHQFVSLRYIFPTHQIALLHLEYCNIRQKPNTLFHVRMHLPPTTRKISLTECMLLNAWLWTWCALLHLCFKRGSENAQHYAVCGVNYMWHRLSDKKPLAFNNSLIMAYASNASGDAFDVALDPLIPTKREGGKKTIAIHPTKSPSTLPKSSIWMTNQN